MSLRNINVDEGFLPHFSKDFIGRYGQESIFVFAVSDLYTRATARLLDAKGLLKSWDSVAYFGTDEAVEVLSELVMTIPQGKQTLLQDACGSAESGSFERLVVSSIGGAGFRSWLEAFQTLDFAKASKILRDCKT
jgi:hypothetical protein